MAAMRSDNLIMTRAPLVGAFAFRRYDRGIREVHCISTPVIASVVVEANLIVQVICRYHFNLF